MWTVVRRGGHNLVPFAQSVYEPGHDAELALLHCSTEAMVSFPSCVDQKGLVGCGLACLLTGSVNILHGHFEGEHVHHDGAIDVRI